MVEFLGNRPGIAIPDIQTESLPKVGWKKPLALTTVGLLFTAPYLVFGKDTVNTVTGEISDIQIEQLKQPDLGWVDNGKIRIAPSSLPGVLDLKRYDPENGLWPTYNVIVPNAVANGIETSAELFNTQLTMTQGVNEHGDTTFEIQYEKMHGIRFVDGVISVGNDAHFKLVGIMPKDTSDVSIKLVPNDDSAPIKEFSLGNYYGSLENIDTVQVVGGKKYRTDDYPTPNDGNLIGGDWYPIVVPENGKIYFEKKGDTMRQYQEFTGAKRGDIENRSVEWRREFGDYKRKPWTEAVRIWLSSGGTCTFGYEGVA
jgi:hypothetical protein